MLPVKTVKGIFLPRYSSFGYCVENDSLPYNKPRIFHWSNFNGFEVRPRLHSSKIMREARQDLEKKTQKKKK